MDIPFCPVVVLVGAPRRDSEIEQQDEALRLHKLEPKFAHSDQNTAYRGTAVQVAEVAPADGGEPAGELVPLEETRVVAVAVAPEAEAEVAETAVGHSGCLATSGP